MYTVGDVLPLEDACGVPTVLLRVLGQVIHEGTLGIRSERLRHVGAVVGEPGAHVQS
ncbi:MAG: hypothetical protein ACT4PJ_06770 [Gemmatimonadaceae bacterium]